MASIPSQIIKSGIDFYSRLLLHWIIAQMFENVGKNLVDDLFRHLVLSK